jgi:hypothetical protein
VKYRIVRQGDGRYRAEEKTLFGWRQVFGIGKGCVDYEAADTAEIVIIEYHNHRYGAEIVVKEFAL